MSVYRCEEPGYHLAAMNDNSERRGIWYRQNTDEEIEVCAGREGDTDYASFKVGQVLTQKDIKNLADCFSTGAWMVSLNFRSKYHLEKLQPIADLLGVSTSWLNEFIPNHGELDALKYSLQHYPEETITDLRDLWINWDKG